MARPTQCRFTWKRDQADTEPTFSYHGDVAGLREAQTPRAPEPTPVVTLDLATLPDRAMLDADMPIEQLYAEHPKVRAYLFIKRDAKTGATEIRIRQGIPPEWRAVAQDILRKYGQKPRRRVQGTLVEH